MLGWGSMAFAKLARSAALGFVLALSPVASAQFYTSPDPPPPPVPYIAPFQLRGVVPKSGIRLDTTLASYEYLNAPARMTVLFLSGQLRLLPVLAVQARWGFDENRVAQPDVGRTGVVNPTLGLLLGVPLDRNVRFAASASVGA